MIGNSDQQHPVKSSNGLTENSQLHCAGLEFFFFFVVANFCYPLQHQVAKLILW